MIMSGRIANFVRSVSRRLRPWSGERAGDASPPSPTTACAPAAQPTHESPRRRGRGGVHPTGVDEPAAIEALLRTHVRDGMNCVDVGAHIGGLTELLTSLSRRGKHVAIEPMPFNAKWLKENYPQVEVVECAVADAPGRATLFRGERAYDVDVRRLDDVVPSERTIELLKLAAEGSELDAFRGAQRILRRDRPLVIFECALRGANAFQYSAADVYAFLARHHYAIYTPVDLVAGRGPLDEVSFERAVRFPFRAFHFVGLPATPPSRMERDAPPVSLPASYSAAAPAAMFSEEVDGERSETSCFPYGW